MRPERGQPTRPPTCLCALASAPPPPPPLPPPPPPPRYPLPTAHRATLRRRYDLRARFNLQHASWPAWWLTADSEMKWPMSGEVDMLEYHHDCESGRCPGELYPSAAYQPHGRGAEVHWTPTGEWKSPRLDAAFEAEFHNYTFRWSDTFLDFFIDGVHVRRAPELPHRVQPGVSEQVLQQVRAKHVQARDGPTARQRLLHGLDSGLAPFARSPFARGHALRAEPPA